MNVFRKEPRITSAYLREEAKAYTERWALGRNPRYFDYSSLGGDCTNFASQVLYAGGALMNYATELGWYYQTPNQKSPSWTGVNFLYQFLTGHSGPGPVAVECNPKELEIADLIQLSFTGDGVFHHTLVIVDLVKNNHPEQIRIATHSPNLLNVKLSEAYSWAAIRHLHILGNQG